MSPDLCPFTEHLVFKYSFNCMNPFIVNKNSQDKEAHPAPCGKCIMCRKRRINQWAFRLQEHFKQCHTAWFITLTYDTDHIPFTPTGLKTISKRDIQLFFKKLRKTTTDKISYYVAGEYGESFERPHYHIILFNARVETIQNAWDKGMVYYGDVNIKSIRYTLKYLHKPTKIPLFDGDDRQPEFQLNSKGLGLSYLTEDMIKWHKHNPTERNYVNFDGNKKMAMPRYFKDKIFNDLERDKIQSKQKRQANYNQMTLENMSVYDSQKFIHQVKETNKHIERQMSLKNYDYV